MSIKFDSEDHSLVDSYLDNVLERYRTGDWNLVEARTNLAEAIALINDGDKAFRIHMVESMEKAPTTSPALNL